MRLFIFHNLLLTGLSTTTTRPDRRLPRKSSSEGEVKLQSRLLGSRQPREEKAVRMRCFGWVRDKGGSGTSDEGF
jgi:hypothetical protein